MASLKETAQHIKHSAQQASTGLVGRETLIDLILLSCVAEEHLLIIGPPGTGKSAVVRAVSDMFDSQYFEYLLGRFTEPSELFGPIDLQKLKDGIVETSTKNMLPEADIVFLDEVFLGSTAILNALLGILNERTFRRGQTQLKCPLRICVAASNHLPQDDSLSAFADRFLVHYFVDNVPDSQLESLLENGWQYQYKKAVEKIELAHLDQLTEACRQADMSDVTRPLADCIRLLRKANILLSDRRIIKAQRLIAAAAILDGRTKPSTQDLWPLLYVVGDEQTQQTARDLLKDTFASAHNEILSAAAEHASRGPLARAQQLQTQVEALLEQPAETRNALALEAMGREIDIQFSLETLPEGLKQAREALLVALGTVA
jgi:MoxR-like ATPase